MNTKETNLTIYQNMYSEEENEDIERNDLLVWIPSLVKEKLASLSTEQLRILHYVLGYNCNEASTESLVEEFEGHGYSEDTANEFANILKRDNFLVIEKPY